MTGKQIECQSCGYQMTKEEFHQSLKVCPKCNYHHIMSARERLEILADEGTFIEYDAHLYSINPLDFPAYLTCSGCGYRMSQDEYDSSGGRCPKCGVVDVVSTTYESKLEQDRKRTGLGSDMISGECEIGGYPTIIAIGDAGFIMGSMGSVVGEKITRSIERAIEKGYPIVIVSAFGGGARMHEGTISLMQMAKTSAACAKLSQAGLLYISAITHPTMGGTAASFASLGHIIIAEPGAMIGFSGPRTRASIREELPPNFQKSEFLLEHGMIDHIFQRKDMKNLITNLLRFFWESRQCSKNG